MIDLWLVLQYRIFWPKIGWDPRISAGYPPDGFLIFQPWPLTTYVNILIVSFEFVQISFTKIFLERMHQKSCNSGMKTFSPLNDLQPYKEKRTFTCRAWVQTPIQGTIFIKLVIQFLRLLNHSWHKAMKFMFKLYYLNLLGKNIYLWNMTYFFIRFIKKY